MEHIDNNVDNRGVYLQAVYIGMSIILLYCGVLFVNSVIWYKSPHRGEMGR